MLSSGDLTVVLPFTLPVELVTDVGSLVWAAVDSAPVLLADSAAAAAAAAADCSAARRVRSRSRSAVVSADMAYVFAGFSRTRYFL